MSEIEKLINSLLEKTENREKKQELIGEIGYFSFDNIFDLLEVFVKVLNKITPKQKAQIERFNNAYSELYNAEAEVKELIFTVIAGMEESTLEDFEKFIQKGF